MDILRAFLVLIASISLLFFLTYLFRLTFNISRRLAMLQAFVTVGGLAWFITEMLGAFRAITFIGLAITWGIAGLSTILMLARISGGNFIRVIFTDLQDMRGYLLSLPRELLAVLLCILVGMLILGVTAFVATPNTWDSMTYHLSRVMHWEQNQSLAFYPTSISRQLYLGPMAEIIILNLKMLAGNDRLANFVQFFAMIGCVVGGSLIARLLGGDIHVQVFTSFTVMTLPMGILQSTSTQNDYVIALWLVCFVTFMLMQLQADKPSLTLVFLMGVSLGLAILTKATVFLFGASFGVWLALESILRFKAKAWKYLIVLLCVALLIIAPHIYRNYELYRNPLGPMVESGDVSYSFTNDIHGIRALTSNILRNAAIHFALPFGGFNDEIQKAVVLLHIILKIDVNDPRITWTDTNFLVKYSTHEDLAGNPFHMILIIVCAFLMLSYKKTRLVVFSLCLAAGFVLFSGLLKWQPWHSRLHLPLFVLGMPFVGVVLSNNPKRWMLYVAVFVLSFMSIRYFFLNPMRPLIGTESIFTTDRLNQYFSASPDKFKSYSQQTKAVSELQCNDIGLLTTIDDWEYPLWVMTKAYGRDFHLEHILVKNPSRMLETGFIPCAIVATYPLQEQTLIYQNKVFIKLREDEPLSLFVLQTQ